MLLEARIPKKLDVRIEEEAIAATRVGGEGAKFLSDAGNGAGEIGIHGEFRFGRPVRFAGSGIVGEVKVAHCLSNRFAPEIIERHLGLYAIKTPEPVMSDGSI